MVALFIVAGVGYALDRWAKQGHSVRTVLTASVAVVAVVAALGTSVQVARIGHSGAAAAWDDTDMSSTTLSP